MMVIPRTLEVAAIAVGPAPGIDHVWIECGHSRFHRTMIQPSDNGTKLSNHRMPGYDHASCARCHNPLNAHATAETATNDKNSEINKNASTSNGFIGFNRGKGPSALNRLGSVSEISDVAGVF
jgi:hypothetical protein